MSRHPASPLPTLDLIASGRPERRRILESQMYGRFQELGGERFGGSGLNHLEEEISGHVAAALRETASAPGVWAAGDSSSAGAGAGASSLRVSELNGALARGESLPRPRALLFDEPLRLVSGRRFSFEGIAIRCAEGFSFPFLVEGEQVENAAVEHFDAELAGPAGFLRLRECRRMELSGNTVSGAFFGIVLRDGNREIAIRGNRLRHTTRSPLYLQGDNEWVEIRGNSLFGTGASSNWAAGVVLSAAVIRDPFNLATDFWADYHWPIPDKVRNRLRCPKHILCAGNEIRDARASGIFCDGTFLCVLSGNRIEHCDKEGLCLDIGSCLTLVENNVIAGNGNRALQSDEDLKNDFVLWGGRDATGAARCKLPGVSMDNSLLNIVRGNFVRDNYGGGVKMVRTCFLNLIDGNVIERNTSAEATQWNFPGVLIEGSEPDAVTDEHDFLPSHGNVVSHNVILGHDPAPGLIVRDNCSDNVLRGNAIASKGLGIEARYARRLRVEHNAAPGGIMIWRPLYSPLRRAAGQVRRRLKRAKGGAD